MFKCRITPDAIWQFRRNILGGKSAVTGAPLPETLANCNPDVQADHYAQACYFVATHEIPAADLHEHPELLSSVELQGVPVPPGIDADRAAWLRAKAIEQVLLDHGAA